jgi:hypothetical protein
VLSWIKTAWKALGFIGALTGLGLLALAGGLVTGFWTVLSQFPWYSKVAVLIGIAILIGVAIHQRRQLWTWAERLTESKTETGITQKLVDAPGAHIEGLVVSDNAMEIRPGSEPPKERGR